MKATEAMAIFLTMALMPFPWKPNIPEDHKIFCLALVPFEMHKYTLKANKEMAVP